MPAHSTSTPLYGRNNERRILEELSSHTSLTLTTPTVAFIEGEAGAGKTSLAKQVASLSGKFNPENNIPYAPFIEIINTKLRDILSHPEKKNYWAKLISFALGDNYFIMKDLIPLLAPFGNEGHVETENQEREIRIQDGFIQLFFTVLAQEHFRKTGKPLTLLIDDAQWIDITSKNLLKRLTTHQSSHPLIILIASRTNALSAEFENTRVLKINNLDKDAITGWIKNKFAFLNSTHIHDLIDTIFRHTQGNPFLIQRLFLTYENEDVTSVNEMMQLCDPSSFLDLALKNWSSDEITRLKRYACLGESFTTVHKNPALEKAIAHHIIQETREHHYCFTHANVHQAILDKLSPEEEVDLHYQIGQALKYDPSETANAAYHLNKARRKICSGEEEFELDLLNLNTARLAHSQAAWGQALAHLNEITVDWDEEKHYIIACEVYKLKAIINATLGNFSEAQHLFQQLLENAKNKEDKAFALLKKFKIYFAQFNFGEAIEASGRCLALCGVSTLMRIEERDKALDFISLELLSSLIFSAYLNVNHDDFVNFVKIAQAISDTYPGNNFAALIETWYALALLIQGCANEALTQTKKAKLMLDVNPSAKEKETIYIILGASLWHFIRPHQESINLLDTGAMVSLSTGNKIYETFCRGNEFIQLFFADTPLTTLRKKYTQTYALVQASNMPSALRIIMDCNLLMDAFVSGTPIMAEFSEETLKEEVNKRRPINAHGYYLHFLLQEKYFLARNSFPSEYFFLLINEAEYARKNTPGFIHTAEHYFYKGLVLCVIYQRPSTTPEVKEALLTDINQCLAQLEEYSNNCPENFEHKYLLLRAEQKNLLQQWKAARNDYFEAITKSKQHGFLRLRALACELFAAHWKNENNPSCDELHSETYQTGAKRYYFEYNATYLSQPTAEKPSNTLQFVHEIIKSLGQTTIEEIIKKILHVISTEMQNCTRIEYATSYSGESRSMVVTLSEGEFSFSQDEDEDEIHSLTKSGSFHRVKATGKFETVDHTHYVPITLNNQIAGILYIETISPLDREKHEKLVSLGTLIANFLENRHLLKKLEEDQRTQDTLESFISMLCHEIRNILNGFVYYIDQLKSLAPSAAVESLDSMEKMVYTVSRFLNTQLDAAKIASGKVSLQLTHFDYKKLITDAVAICKSAAIQKNINFTYTLPTENYNVHGDAMRITQILINLINNAIKFTLSGKAVRLICESPSITDDQALFAIRIEDEGIGMTPSELEKLFKPYQQANDNIAQSFGGTGLGLHTCKSLLDLMKGDLTVKSKKNVGTTFTISIPLKLAPQNEATPISERRSSIENIERLKEQVLADYPLIRILIADDSDINRRLIKGFIEKSFSREKVLIDVAVDGKEAITKFQQGNFDLIFMDIQMPTMRGDEATLEIRKFEEKSQKQPVTIICVSGDKQTDVPAGMNTVLEKPINRETFLYTTLTQLSIAKNYQKKMLSTLGATSSMLMYPPQSSPKNDDSRMESFSYQPR